MGNFDYESKTLLIQILGERRRKDLAFLSKKMLPAIQR
jgi:hypothetical protein